REVVLAGDVSLSQVLARRVHARPTRNSTDVEVEADESGDKVGDSGRLGKLEQQGLEIDGAEGRRIRRLLVKGDHPAGPVDCPPPASPISAVPSPERGMRRGVLVEDPRILA